MSLGYEPNDAGFRRPAWSCCTHVGDGVKERTGPAGGGAAHSGLGVSGVPRHVIAEGLVYPSSSPSSRALATAWLREEAPSLRYSEAWCDLTVCSDTNNSAAISAEER